MEATGGWQQRGDEPLIEAHHGDTAAGGEVHADLRGDTAAENSRETS
jgi:hypothetical protein